MKNDFDNLIADIREKLSSIKDEKLRDFMLIYVSLVFAQKFIKTIIENKEEIYFEKLN